MPDDHVFCSLCFNDEGLRLEAAKCGIINDAPCRSCGSTRGAKLNLELLETLLVEFFWNGSFFRTDFGGAHRLVSNPMRYGEREVEFPPWLRDDAYSIEDALKVGLFHYGPPLWRLGAIEPLTALVDETTRAEAVDEVLSTFSDVTLPSGFRFYRLRKNLSDEEEFDHAQYDSPPNSRSTYGRMDSERVSVLYGSPDLEACVHECRVIIPDECFVATMRTTVDLRVLNLAAEISEDGTPFETMNFAMQFLFAAESHSYPITRAITEAVARKGFDGILYPSYFRLVRPDSTANIALFGHPVQEKR